MKTKHKVWTGDGHNFKAGEVVYLKNVGFPHNKTDNGHESWEGVSGTVVENPALSKQAPGATMVYVRAFHPLKIGRGDFMIGTFFFPEQVKRENRPWLKKHLKAVFQSQKELMALRDKLTKLLPETPDVVIG